MARNETRLMRRVVAILSGGMDSTTLVYFIKSRLIPPLRIGTPSWYDLVSVLSFDYGQRHRKELEMAAATCRKLGLPHKVVDISGLKVVMRNSALTDDVEVPEGHYTDVTMRQTVVPNRNMIMLSIAIAEAVSLEAEAVFYGAHAGDHEIYPDCRSVFVDAMHNAAQLANYNPVAILAPFLVFDKGDIAKIGRDLGVDYSLTWTCYKGEEKPCGKCGACVERAEAFAKANMTDPLIGG